MLQLKILDEANRILSYPNKRDIYDKVGLYGLKTAEWFQNLSDCTYPSKCQQVGV